MSDFSAQPFSTFRLTVTDTEPTTGAPPEAVVLGVIGDLDRCTAPMLSACLSRLLSSADDVGIVVDLTKTPFVDVGGLNALLTAGRRARESGGSLGLVGCSAQVLRLVHLAGAADLFAGVTGREQSAGAPQPPSSSAHTDLPWGSSRTPHSLDSPATTSRPRPRAAERSTLGEVGMEQG